MAKNEKSVTDLVCEHIKKQKLLPIPVQTLNEEAEATRYFGGDLKEFLAAAKTLGAKGIFVETLYLEDDEFYYDSGIDDEEYLAMNGDFNNECCCGENCNCKKGDKKKSKKAEEDDKVDGVLLEPEDLEGLDLSLLRPEIAKFLDRVGESCGVRLTVPGVDHLEVEIFADWYDEFAELVDEASEIIEEDPNGALEQVEAMFKEAEKAAKDEDKSVKKIAAHPPKKTASAKAKK
ncbi:hypothetical protein B7990_06125 [Fibrobacter sp. UWB4]|jgi:hypothetical protein|uniref:hypothetical protein n=1 Tax=Fibrobacter sp. UWB4 TaxID=1964356 RepID=UPI000B523C3A|nr:hypothetical protein [Fibrobacter sp. UWB4]OWV18841.1 hypothetical protein B7990_06125 [Fibrobacter sp. UWB4]